MRTIYIFLISLFIQTSPKIIIRDVQYNINYIEDMDQYENNSFPEGSQFFILFPYSIENTVEFNFTIPNNISIFPIYFSEFSEYPNETEINNTEFINEIVLTNQEEDEQYIKYSYDIKKTQSYLVLYFQNNETLNYMSFFAYSRNSTNGTITCLDLPMNYSFSLFSLEKKSSYYLKLNISTARGIALGISTSASISYLPDYNLDIKYFQHDPSENEIRNDDINWIKNLSYKLNQDYYYNIEYRKYEYELDQNYSFCAFHIYNKNLLNKLNIYIFIIRDTSATLPTWVIVIFAIIAIAIIIGICIYFRKLRSDPLERQKAAACCLGTCICLTCIASITVKQCQQ